MEHIIDSLSNDELDILSRMTADDIKDYLESVEADNTISYYKSNPE